MDEQHQNSPRIQSNMNESGDEPGYSSEHFSSAAKHVIENKIVRRPGRPPLRIKNRLKRSLLNNDFDNEIDEDFEGERPKPRQKNYYYRDDKDSSLDGFIRIIDYLKKIQCDQTSLQNKMNPYNILTPTCFWYMVSAQYYSFDFFAYKNPQDVALDFLRRAQRTQINLPLRFLKPQRSEYRLQFETEQLKFYSTPLTQKLTFLTNNLSPPPITSENIEKSGFITSVAEDNYFRSSTRAIVYNWIKRKIKSSDKWNSILKSKLQENQILSGKQFISRIYEIQEEVKHEQLDAAPEIFGRQRKRGSGQRRGRGIRREGVKQKRNRRKKKVEDEIFDESESNQAPKNDSNKEIELENQEINNSKQNQNNEEQDQGEEQQYDQCQIQEQQSDQEDVQDDLNPEGVEEQPLKMLDEQNEERDGENEDFRSSQKQNNIMDEQLQKIEPEEQIKHEDMKQEQGSNKIIEKPKVIAKKAQYIKTSKNYSEEDILLDAILHMPLDNVISILKSSIQTPKMPYITKPFLSVPKADPLELVYQIHPDEQVFLNYMRQRQQKIYQQKQNDTQVNLEQKQRQVQAEDAKCQVCTDGDYTQDNLIVFCSMCNISLHQRCVGLAKVPADNWICELCTSFGPSGINVPCPLCHVKGGALKRTNIHINTPLFKDTNPEYHQYAKKCPNYKHKEQYINPANLKGDEEPYYDYFLKSTYPTDEPICHYVWVHYVCAIWVPECYFEEKNGFINIKGVENIDKKRFKERCLVCKQLRGGACVKCDNENCGKFYHPECARKKKIYMQQLNLDKLKYLIFCQAHEPLKVKRKIDIKKKKQRDQIVKFCRGIEKFVQTYKISNLPFKLSKIGTNQITQINKSDLRKDKGGLGVEQKIQLKIEKNTDEDFIKSVIQGLIKQNQVVVTLSCLGNERYKVDQVIKPSKRDMRKSLTRIDEFWKGYKNNDSSQFNLRRFNSIMRQNLYLKEKIQHFINFGFNAQENGERDEKKTTKRVGRRKKLREIETVIEQKGAIFCVCKKPYNGENNMFQCEVCNQWYHYDCIGFIGTEEDAQKLDFHCMKCLKYESSEEKKQLLSKCSHFFSEDSLFLNYRPPTPSLHSEVAEEIDERQILDDRNFYTNNKSNSTNISIQYISSYPEQKINLQNPFIVFNPHQKPLNQQKRTQQEHNISSLIPNRSFSNQSSQLVTPEFRPEHHFSFAPSQEYLERENQGRGNLESDQCSRSQKEAYEDVGYFQFNREQVVRLKKSIQLEQKEEKIEKND